MEQHPICGHPRQNAIGMFCDGAQFKTIPVVHGRGRVGQSVGIVVARLRIVARLFLCVVAHAIFIDIGCTVATAHAEGIKGVAVAITCPIGQISTTASIDRSWPVAHTAGIL